MGLFNFDIKRIFDKTDKFYKLERKILSRIIDKDTSYIIESNILVEQLIKYNFRITNDENIDFIDLINDYISNAELKGKLHSLRVNSNNLKHNETYEEDFSIKKAYEIMEIIDSFLDYLSKSKLAKKRFEYFSLIKEFGNESMIYDKKINNGTISNLTFTKKTDFKLDPKIHNYISYVSSYTTDNFYLKISKGDKINLSCPSIFSVIHNILNRSTLLMKSTYLREFELSNLELSKIHKYEFLILHAMRYNHFNFTKQNYVSIENNEKIYVEYAYNNILYYADLINNMAENPIDLTKFKLIIKSNSHDDFNINGFNIKYDYADNIPESFSTEMFFSKEINYTVNEKNINYYNIFLKEFFGFEQFRNGQLLAIKKILENNNKTIPLCIFPTGYGKSLIYQFCALLQPMKTIVIVPTEILAYDQVFNLQENGLNISEMLTSNDYNYTDLRTKNPSLLFYITPEIFINSLFNKFFLNEDNDNKIFNIVLDECHNISLWGHQFQPTYFSLSKSIVNNFKNAKISMFTATASQLVCDDIKLQFSKSNIDIIRPVPLDRGNINYDFISCKKTEQIYTKIVKLFNDNFNKKNMYDVNEDGLTLIINNDKDILNNLYNNFRENDKLKSFVSLFDDTVGCYKNFRCGNKKILLSNDDFVVGINIQNLKNLICIGMPPSQEWLYQESGRVGRIGQQSIVQIYTIEKPSKAFELLLSEKNSFDDLISQINSDNEFHIDISNVNYLISYFQDKNNQLKLFDYFNEQVQKNIYVVGKSHYGSVSFSFDIEDRNIYDYLFYMLVIIDYVYTWLTEFTNDRFKINYKLNCSANIELEVMIASTQNKIRKQTYNNNLLNKYDSLFEECKTLRELLEITISWYYDNILSIKRQMLINTYQLITNKNYNSEDIEQQLASYFSSNTIKQEQELDLIDDNKLLQFTEGYRDNDYTENYNYNSENESNFKEINIYNGIKKQFAESNIINNHIEATTENNNLIEFLKEENDIDDKKKYSRKQKEKSKNKIIKIIESIKNIDSSNYVDFSFYDDYLILTKEDKYNIKFILQREIETGYCFGIELLLSIIELHEENKNLVRFKKLIDNSNKEYITILLDKLNGYISKSMKKRAYKELYKIYKPSNLKEYIKIII